jgi:hypothetical protein
MYHDENFMCVEVFKCLVVAMHVTASHDKRDAMVPQTDTKTYKIQQCLLNS